VNAEYRTFIGGLRNSGMSRKVVLDAPINGAAFQRDIGQALMLEMKPSDGDPVLPSALHPRCSTPSRTPSSN